MIGQAFALEHLRAPASAMWCDTMPQTPPGATQIWADREKIVRDANSLLPLADVTVERWLTDAVKTNGQTARSRSATPSSAPSPPAIWAARPRSATTISCPRLPSLKLPVLVVCGADDAGTPPEANRRIASLVPDARYEQIAAARHFPNVEHPETFNHIMIGLAERPPLDKKETTCAWPTRSASSPPPAPAWAVPERCVSPRRARRSPSSIWTRPPPKPWCRHRGAGGQGDRAVRRSAPATSSRETSSAKPPAPSARSISCGTMSATPARPRSKAWTGKTTTSRWI